MLNYGYVLYSRDREDREYQPIKILGFSQNKEDLEKELSILEKIANQQLEDFEKESPNCDKYIEAFNKAWQKFEQKNVIPFYTKGIPQPQFQPRTKEEHAEYKRIKDFNTENGIKNRSFNFSEKWKFLNEWRQINPPHESFAKFIEVSQSSTFIMKSNFRSNYIDYNISKIGEELT